VPFWQAHSSQVKVWPVADQQRSKSRTGGGWLKAYSELADRPEAETDAGGATDARLAGILFAAIIRIDRRKILDIAAA